MIEHHFRLPICLVGSIIGYSTFVYKSDTIRRHPSLIQFLGNEFCSGSAKILVYLCRTSGTISSPDNLYS